MFRLIGFLIGSIASGVVILLLIGMPNFELADSPADQRRFDEAIEKLKAKQSEFETVAGKLSEDVARVARSVEQGESASGDDSMARQGNVDPATPGDAAEIDAIVPAGPPAPVQPADQTKWYSFWNPFGSEIAANGFVSQLENVTGLDYRVVKVKTGVYEVAFPYRDEEERRSRIRQISTATGLNLSES
jgi:hypothetical protein